MLQAVDGDRPLTDLGLVVAGLPLARLVGISGELAGEHDAAIRPPLGCDAGLLAHMPEFHEHGIGVVDGYYPTAHHGAAEGMLVVAILPDRGHLLEVRQDVFNHSRPDVVSHSAGRHVDHADGRLGEVQLWHLAELVGELGAADNRMEKCRMNRVHGIFEDL